MDQWENILQLENKSRFVSPKCLVYLFLIGSWSWYVALKRGLKTLIAVNEGLCPHNNIFNYDVMHFIFRHLSNMLVWLGYCDKECDPLTKAYANTNANASGGPTILNQVFVCLT